MADEEKPAPGTVPAFTLHDIPTPVWTAFSARAERDGWRLRPLIKQLLADYGNGLVSPTRGPR